MITTLLFDLDNTLINRNHSIRCIHEIIVDEDFPDLDTNKRELVLNNLKNWDYFGYVPHETVIRTYIKTYGKFRDINETAAFIRANQGMHAVLLPHCIEVLHALKKHYTLALVTNGSAVGQRLKIEKTLGPHVNLFKEVIISGDLNIHKPNPKIYEEALKRLNVNSDTCVFIGDDLINDIDAPLKLGMKAIRFNHCHLVPTERVLEITDLRQLLEIDFDSL